MAGFLNAISAVLLLFSIMAVGYLMGWKGWMTAEEKKFLSRFVVNIAVPCNAVVGLLNNLEHDDLLQAGFMVITALMGIGSTLILGAVAATLLKLPKQRWGVFTSMAGTSNTLFIGLPMSTQLFGEVCIPFVMVYYLSSSMLTQSVVVLLVERAGSKEARGLSLPGLLKDVFTKPPILGLLVGILCLALDVRPPELVMQFAGYMSATVIPLALMYCGFILYEVGLKNLRFLPGIPTMLIIRLVVSPLICTGMCALTGITGLARSVFIVEAALPVVTQITVMAGAYGADEEYAAVGSSLSMLGSFFTIPILMLILG
jgi:hypothetical protein